MSIKLIEITPKIASSLKSIPRSAPIKWPGKFFTKKFTCSLNWFTYEMFVNPNTKDYVVDKLQNDIVISRLSNKPALLTTF